MKRHSSSEQELRSLYGYPEELVTDAYAEKLEDKAKAFIRSCPFLVLSSVNDQGYVDMSPRGGAPGFIEIINDKNIAFLDQMGNRKLHTLSNLLKNPRIGLLFLVPGVGEVLRAYGVAQAVHDEDLILKMGGDTRRNKSVIQIQIERIFPHCPSAIKKSDIWNSTPREPPETPNIMEFAKSMAQSRKE